MVGCWHGYLSAARCRFAYGLADTTPTHCLLLQEIQIGFGFTFLVPAHLGSHGQSPEGHKTVVAAVVIVVVVVVVFTFQLWIRHALTVLTSPPPKVIWEESASLLLTAETRLARFMCTIPTADESNHSAEIQIQIQIFINTLATTQSNS